MITENILAVVIITFKYFSNTFGYLRRKFVQHKKQMCANGNILIQIYEWEKEHRTNKSYWLLWTIKVAHFKIFSQFQTNHGVQD